MRFTAAERQQQQQMQLQMQLQQQQPMRGIALCHVEQVGKKATKNDRKNNK